MLLTKEVAKGQNLVYLVVLTLAVLLLGMALLSVVSNTPIVEVFAYSDPCPCVGPKTAGFDTGSPVVGFDIGSPVAVFNTGTYEVATYYVDLDSIYRDGAGL